jgi:DNA-binding winged helix-turn-helix (wHTH) protein
MNEQSRRVRFGPFELDSRSGELWRNGRRVNLQEQPLAVLRALLDQPGEIVKREDLFRLLWPSDTFVDFEHGLNAAIKRLRDALGDNADVPRYIQTIPRRGYRFVDAVEVSGKSLPGEETTHSGAIDLGSPSTVSAPGDSVAASYPLTTVPPPLNVDDGAPGTLDEVRPSGLKIWQKGWVSAVLLVVLVSSVIALISSRSGGNDATRVGREEAGLDTSGVPKAAAHPQSTPSDSTLRFEMRVPSVATLTADRADARISPDGRHVVFVAWRLGRSELWVRPLGSLEAFPVSGTDGAMQPFWSPDSRVIGFQADGMLRKVPLAGGPIEQICAARHLAGATWGAAHVIVFSQIASLFRVPDTGGTPVQMRPPSGIGPDAVVVEPAFLPDGHRLLFRVGYGAAGAQGTYVSSIDNESSTRLVDVGINVAYAAGHFLFVRHGTLFARAFDIDAPPAAGNPVAIAERVFENLGQMSGPSISVSNTGTVVYRERDETASVLKWLDRQGNVVGVPKAPDRCTNPEISPADQSIAVECTDVHTGHRDIWVLSAEGKQPLRATEHPSGGSDAVWSPDGEWLAFSSDRDGSRNLYRRRWHKAGADEPVLTSAVTKYPSSWSNDGRTIAFTARGPTRLWDIWSISLATHEVHPLVSTAFNDIEPQFSPDSSWLAYTSDESGRWEVYLRSLEGGQPSAHAIAISGAAGGSDPRWGANGRELFYLAPDRRLMAVALRGVHPQDVSAPHELFLSRTVGPLGLGLRFNYAVARDGNRFLMNVAEASATPPPYVVVYRWLSSASE